MAAVHGAIYALSGAWPLVDIDSFMAVTGPKLDVWLVRTVGLLLTLDGLVLLACAWRRAVPGALVTLVCAHALGLALVDLVYVSIGRIAPIYLADAALESLLIAAWTWAWKHQMRAVAVF